MAHQCPKCELVFAARYELENHLAVDHETDREPSVADPEPAPAPNGDPAVATAGAATADDPEPQPSMPRRSWFARIGRRGREGTERGAAAS
jgi:hypothetical protein